MIAAEKQMKSVFGSLLIVVLAAMPATAQPTQDPQSSFFMGRITVKSNRRTDCAGVGKNMARLVAQVSTVPVDDEKQFPLTDDLLFETPFVFMNGHHDFVLEESELASLRVYLEHGGFLFSSGCCTNPAFPEAWRREMGRLFPQVHVDKLPYEHPIYRTFYRIERVRSRHRNVNVYLEGLYLDGWLVAVLCEDGLCCAFSADNRCNPGRGIDTETGKKLAVNVAVYAMTH